MSRVAAARQIIDTDSYISGLEKRIGKAVKAGILSLNDAALLVIALAVSKEHEDILTVLKNMEK